MGDTELTPRRSKRAPSVAEVMSAAAHCVRTDDMVEALTGRHTPLTLHKAQFENAGAYGELVDVLRRLLECASEDVAPHTEGRCSKCGLSVAEFLRMLTCKNLTLVTYRDGRGRASTSSVTCDFDRESCSVDLDTVRDGTARIVKLCAC